MKKPLKKPVARKRTVANHPSMPSAKTEQEWQAESDARTLLEAEKIKSDKSRVAAAKRMAKKQADALTAVVKG